MGRRRLRGPRQARGGPVEKRLDMPAQPPNILLITTDQQRLDTLSCLGAPIGRTPHLDALAARGVIFERRLQVDCPPPLCEEAGA